MKYIRTKDNIYEVYTKDLDLNDKTHRDIAGFRAQHCKGWNCPPLEPEDIFKVADTIEELCDEFVDADNHDYYKISHKGGITYALSKTDRLLGNYDIRCKEIGQIMGSIYTDKGLIYVAKMNDKGKLELL